MRALLLIAHGSRRAEANADLDWVADGMRARGTFDLVQTSYLEFASPTIPEAGDLCVQAGAKQVILMPYFLAPGIHVTEDLHEAMQAMTEKHPDVQFHLAPPLGRHELLIEIVHQRSQCV